MAASLISGSTLATYVLVSATWLAVHTATTDTGARTQPTTISSAATGVRQPRRRRAGLSGGRPAPAPPTRQRLQPAPFTGAEVAVFGSWDADIPGIAHEPPPIIVVRGSRYLWCVCFAKATTIMMFPLVRRSCRPQSAPACPAGSHGRRRRHEDPEAVGLEVVEQLEPGSADEFGVADANTGVGSAPWVSCVVRRV